MTIFGKSLKSLEKFGQILNNNFYSVKLEMENSGKIYWNFVESGKIW